MMLSEKLTDMRRLGGLIGITGKHQLARMGANLVDPGDGVIEQRISQVYGRTVLEYLDLPVETRGLEQIAGLRRYCVVSTHTSYLDFAVLLGHFPVPLRFIAKKELASVPAIGGYLKLRGVLIDRKKGIDAKSAIRTAVDEDLPWPILIFPEGTRSRDGSIGPFRRGGLQILADAGLTLVPVTIRNTHQAWPRDSYHIRTGMTLQMLIGEPVPPNGAAEDRMKLVEQRVRALAD